MEFDAILRTLKNTNSINFDEDQLVEMMSYAAISHYYKNLNNFKFKVKLLLRLKFFIF
jgi:hypothetical protein